MTDRIDEGKLKEIERLARAAKPGPWTVYRCSYAHEDPESACGLNGVGFDASYDECHHTMDLADATYIAACSPDTILALVAEVKLHRKLRRLPLHSAEYLEIDDELDRLEFDASGGTDDGR